MTTMRWALEELRDIREHARSLFPLAGNSVASQLDSALELLSLDVPVRRRSDRALDCRHSVNSRGGRSGMSPKCATNSGVETSLLELSDAQSIRIQNCVDVFFTWQSLDSYERITLVGLPSDFETPDRRWVGRPSLRISARGRPVGAPLVRSGGCLELLRPTVTVC